MCVSTVDVLPVVSSTNVIDFDVLSDEAVDNVAVFVIEQM